MNDERLVGAALRIIGLWRIFIHGGDALYFVVVKDLRLATGSALPVSVDVTSLLFNLILGCGIILATPAILRMIFGRKSSPQP